MRELLNNQAIKLSFVITAPRGSAHKGRGAPCAPHPIPCIHLAATSPSPICCSNAFSGLGNTAIDMNGSVCHQNLLKPEGELNSENVTGRATRIDHKPPEALGLQTAAPGLFHYVGNSVNYAQLFTWFLSSNTLCPNGFKHSPLSGRLGMCFLVLSDVQFRKGDLVRATQNKCISTGEDPCVLPIIGRLKTRRPPMRAPAPTDKQVKEMKRQKGEAMETRISV